jgi:two-component system cell cycle sensor histidine kinase/response regulator CckA
MSMMRVLLVEDERISAFNLQQGLRRLGYDVPSIAPSGTKALELIDREQPDIVLMDIHLEGDIDGIETAGRIPPERMIPVIYLTAYSEESTLKRAAETKPYGYLLKPFSDRELHATIQMAMQRHATELALRNSEAELRRSREDFRFLFRDSPLPMWVYDLETTKFIDVNDAAVASYGYSREEFLARSVFDIRPAEDIPQVRNLLGLEAPEYLEATGLRHMRKNGDIILVDVFSHALKFDGRPARVSVAIDVTRRNQAEEQLRHALKMEAVGQLTGGVAHDFNNLLAIMQGNLELLSEKLPLTPQTAEMMQHALAAGERGAILTQRLLAFSRQQPLEPRLLKLGDFIRRELVLLNRTLGETIRISAKIAPDVWPVLIDPGQLGNAILNLAVNARDAMPEGGLLSIGAENTALDQAYAQDNSEVTPGDYVLLSVTDSGTGMTPDVVRHVFEPFFTTKPVGRGTGLGLSMVFGFVKQSGGHVKVYSEPGHGTAIKLYLPRAHAGGPEATAFEKVLDAPERGCGETVLVVEDDSGVRNFIVTLLTDLGYGVREAEDGPLALEWLKKGRFPDLLLSDVVLPKSMSGPALAKAARAFAPDMKVLFMSGYTHDALSREGTVDDGVHIIMKPFRKVDLAAKVRAVLDGKD